MTTRGGEWLYKQDGLIYGPVPASVLLEKVAAAKFTYLQADRGVWVDYWDDRDYPRLIRLEISLRAEDTAGGEKRVPPLVVSIPVGMECRFQ